MTYDTAVARLRDRDFRIGSELQAAKASSGSSQAYCRSSQRLPTSM